MNELNNIFLILITENQANKIQAEKLAEILQNELGKDWSLINIDKYHKFDNSFKIEFSYDIKEKRENEINTLALRFSDKIVSPWLVYFDANENCIELIYNKSEQSLIRQIEFNVIKWGNLQILK